MSKRLYISLFSNLVVIKTLSSSHRMYNLYTKLVKILEICKQFSENLVNITFTEHIQMTRAHITFGTSPHPKRNKRPHRLMQESKSGGIAKQCLTVRKTCLHVFLSKTACLLVKNQTFRLKGCHNSIKLPNFAF